MGTGFPITITQSFLSEINETTFGCNGDESENFRRCIFHDVIVFNGIVMVVSDHNITIPKILCSAVDVNLSVLKLCPFVIKTKGEILKLLWELTNSSTLVGINTESALHFAPLNGYNPYHAIFEEMLPIFEILKSDPILSKWLNESNNNTIKLMNFIPTAGIPHTFSKQFFNRFFPHIDYSFGNNSDWNYSNLNKGNNNNKVYFVKYLVAGSNHSCVNYDICSRSDFVTPYIAGQFRDFILNKVVIIQRENFRVISNLNDLIAMISNETGRTPLVLYYERMTLDDQIRATFNTDILIAIHGGALMNIIYLPPYATVIEIFPYTFVQYMYGMTNWIRYTLRDIPIAHASFDIIEPSHMTYGPDNYTLPLCLSDPIGGAYSSWLMFRRVDYVTIDIVRFQDFFYKELKKWHSRSNYIPPMSREEFYRYRKTFKEPWYNDVIRRRNINKRQPLPTCISLLNGYFKLNKLRWITY
eukprot:gene12914-27242_t